MMPFGFDGAGVDVGGVLICTGFNVATLRSFEGEQTCKEGESDQVNPCNQKRDKRKKKKESATACLEYTSNR